MGQPLSSAAVLTLQKFCRPATVARFVIAVVVDAVERMFRRRRFAHVGVEGFERIKPAVANYNASRSVITVCRGSGIKASLPHILPDDVRSRFLKSLAVRSAVPATIASATAVHPRGKPGPSYNELLAAVAKAPPHRVMVLWPFRQKFNCYKHPVSFAGYVDAISHAPIVLTAGVLAK